MMNLDGTKHNLPEPSNNCQYIEILHNIYKTLKIAIL